MREENMVKQKKKDTRTREMIYPSRIVQIRGNVTNVENLMVEKNLQITTVEPECTILKNDNQEDAMILLDFGRELNGSLRLLTSWCEGCNCVNVQIKLGESVAEALSEIGCKNATNDHAMRDIDMWLPSLSDMVTNESGFRFACIRLKSKNAILRLKAIVAVSIYHDLPYIGMFRCDNEKINAIFDVSAYTCHLCIQNYIWDGIKRDRLVWVGDIHPEMLTIRTVFGDIPMVEETIRFMRERTPLPGWMNEYPTYTIWWLMIVYDWYMYTGNNNFLKENRDYVLGVISQLTKCVNEDGSDNLPGYFLDWPCSKKPEGITGSRALLAIGLDYAEKMSRILGKEGMSKECCRRKKYLTETLPKEHNAKQVVAMLSLADWYDKKIASEIILKNGASGWSTFMSYYLMKAASYGNMSNTLLAMENYFGTMLDLGATTFWEDFDLDWAINACRIDEEVKNGKKDIHGDFGAFCYEGYRHSFCHGWSSASTAFLVEEVLGIKIIEPGCKTMSIKPQLGELKWAKGSYPTPYGIIEVEVTKTEKGDLNTVIRAPEQICII